MYHALRMSLDYNETFAEFYDYLPLYAERQDVAFYVEEAQRAAADAAADATTVLELGCGSGRILIPTAAAGVRIVGLDLSPAMLARCRAKLEAQPAEVRARARLVEGSMTDFRFAEQFQLITTPFRAFQHLLTVSEQLACLACVREHLAPRGRLILDMFHVNPAAMHDPEWMKERDDSPPATLPDGRRFRRTARIAAFHRSQQMNEVEFACYVTHPDGREERITQRFPFRYFFRYEVEHLLARAGFRAVAVYGDFGRSAFADDSTEMITIAEPA
jgi:SAM-dependent methyltransferase